MSYQSQYSSFTSKQIIKPFVWLVIGITLITQGNLDPTPLNPMHSFLPIQNWLGLPGALFAGLFLNLMGYSIFASVFVQIFSFIPRKSKASIIVNSVVFQLALTSAISGLLWNALAASIFGGIWGGSFYMATSNLVVRLLLSAIFLYTCGFMLSRRSLDFSFFITLHFLSLWIKKITSQIILNITTYIVTLYHLTLQISLSDSKKINIPNKKETNATKTKQKAKIKASQDDKEREERKQTILKIKEFSKKIRKKID